MPNSRKPHSDEILRRAEAVRKQAQAFVDKQGPRIEANYATIKGKFDKAAAQLNEMQAVLSRPFSQDVSEAEVDATLDAIQVHALKFPQVPTHKPTLRSSQPQPAPQSAAPVEETHSAKITQLQTQAKSFEANVQSLQVAKTTTELMSVLRKTVSGIDRIYGTRSIDHLNGLQTRYENLQRQVENINKLRTQAKSQHSIQGPLQKAEAKFKVENTKFKTDLAAYKQRVLETCTHHAAQCRQQLTVLNQNAPNASQDHRSPRPGGPRG